MQKQQFLDQDLDKLLARIDAKFAEVKTELLAEVKTELTGLKTELTGLKIELKRDITRLHDEIESVKSFQAYMFSGGPQHSGLSRTASGANVNEPYNTYRNERPLRR